MLPITHHYPGGHAGFLKKTSTKEEEGGREVPKEGKPLSLTGGGEGGDGNGSKIILNKEGPELGKEPGFERCHT